MTALGSRSTCSFIAVCSAEPSHESSPMTPHENLCHWPWIPSVGNMLAWNTLVFSAKSPHWELYLKIFSKLLSQKLQSRTREQRLCFSSPCAIFEGANLEWILQMESHISVAIKNVGLFYKLLTWLENEWRFRRPVYVISKLTSSRCLTLLRNFISTTMIFLNKMCSLKLGLSKLL